MNRFTKFAFHFIRILCIQRIFINSNGKYFVNLNGINVIDLPLLQSITLGEFALGGRWRDKSCSLTMRSTNEMFGNDRM